MKCQEFQDSLAEYVAGRLAPIQSAQMRAHADNCSVCAREEAGERALRARFAQASVTPDCSDLWPRLVSRHYAAPPRRFFGTRLWALGSASAAFAVFAGLFWIQRNPLQSVPTGPTFQAATQGAGETGMLQMVADLRQKPLEESDTLLQNIHTDQQERSVLLGSRGKQ